MLKMRYAFTLCFLFFLTACASSLAPKPPAVFDTRSKDTYSLDRYRTDKATYDYAMEVGQIDRAANARNNMLWSIINDIEHAYGTYKAEFYAGKAKFHTASDLGQLGLSTAATALGGSVILSAAVTALKGAELSIDKNFFRERTSEALFIKMDALRQTELARIESKLRMNPPHYSFEEAYRDTLRLFAAGTVPAALQAIASEAGLQYAKATEEIKTFQEDRVSYTLPPATRSMVELTRQLRIAIDAVKNEPDKHHDKIQKAIAKFGFGPLENASEAWQVLDSQLRTARTEKRLRQIQAALMEAEIIAQETGQ